MYSVDPNGAFDQVTKLHDTWPTKKIWITELAPASGPGDCTLNSAEVIDWMNKLLPRLAKLQYVDKVFWNTATWVSWLDLMSVCVCDSYGQNADWRFDYRVLSTAILTCVTQV